MRPLLAGGVAGPVFQEPPERFAIPAWAQVASRRAKPGSGGKSQRALLSVSSNRMEGLAAVEAQSLVDVATRELCVEARRLRELGHGRLVTYSPKVFIPLTTLCRDVCHYCTFARPPRRGERAYMTADEVLAVARKGVVAGCHEALFTLGDKPELRYRVAREELAALGCETTLEYLARMARLVLEETGLLPHLNPGVMSLEDLRALREVSVSQGIMLESSSTRLAERGGPHFGSPDKRPERRLETIAAAGEARVPLTTGILIGIGETRGERIDALLAIRELGERYGHVQEVIVQNFRAKPGTRMAGHAEPSLEELFWTAAAARVVLGPHWNIQAPPNLSYAGFPRLLDAGINDWGGVSPVTIDHVNPEAPWPEVERLQHETQAKGLELTPRLAVYPQYVAELERWTSPCVSRHVLARADGDGLARDEAWAAGASVSAPFFPRDALPVDTRDELGEEELVRLFRARGQEADRVYAAADRLRREVCGDTVTYVVTRNINYTNVCYFRCGFCAFSKGKLAANLRGRPYLLPLDEIVRRSTEAWERGAVEVCLQGGIHPGLDDEIRRVICPDKVTTDQWLRVHDAAHRAGLRSTTTIMFGHVDGPRNWARHLVRLRDQQRESGGFTEFVPLPFVHMEAPIYLKGRARPGPTFREALLVHAVGRLALHPWITNIQASWVKLGLEGAQAVLRAGANDLGGTLMNESISRAAGAAHGQEMPPEQMEAAIRALRRTPRQRTTLYEEPSEERRRASFGAAPLIEPLNPSVNDAKLVAPPKLVRPGLAVA